MMKPLAAKNSLSISVLQIKIGQQSITTNFWPLTAHKYHIMIIVTGDFSKKSFIIFRSSCMRTFFKTGKYCNIQRKKLC